MAEIKTSFKGVEKLPKLAARIQAIKRFRELVKPIVEEYAPYVMGRYKQASIHQGRWKTDQMIADETKTGVTRKIRVAAKRALENIVP